ncbi:MAG: acetyl-CoA C-acyltransferase [Deltaproteobacteria bacterium]|jgi:acetyl-CoA acyltransferase 2|nr:acetyl-CoA C-acyltransferase [Deltaproteobacteria bacterium]MBP8196633.1 acetyl-CoA C-acyltransferase [Deltaproteobacteria bacterium]
MYATSKDLWFVAAKRTPFGTYGGALKDFTATDLAVHAAKAALAAGGVAATDVDQVIFGNVQQSSADAIYLARHIGLRSGVPIPAPALTLNRLCGSGFQAVVSAAEQIVLGAATTVLCGGTESMSQAPHVLRGARWGWPLGKAPAISDTLWDALTDSFTGMPMAMTAEKLAEQYQLTRAVCDEFALGSQTRWAEAQAQGRFAAELAPIDLVSKKGTVRFAQDEHPRPQTTMETLAKLPTVFKKDGVITAGNASGICDGAAALILTTREHAESKGYTPLGRLVGWGVSGCDPTIMGIGPVPAIRNLLATTRTQLADYDLFDVNEAFAPQFLAVAKELGLPLAQSNVCGGAIALGHPLGASGARITANLLHELKRRGGKRAIGSACIGGGQGIAVAIESI